MATRSEHPSPDYTRRFDTVSCADDSPGRGKDAPVILAEENAAIAKRRNAKGRAQADLTGLALSGGGIRSASFCLGVLQALDAVKARDNGERSALDRIDYLSTVSGGGYIGCCLTACLHAGKGAFPFNETDGKYGDSNAVRHIRDFSNYLMPRGTTDLVTSIGIILCGLAANACLVAPIISLGALALWGVYPTVDDLGCYGRLRAVVAAVPIIPGLPLTTAMLALAFVYLIAWALKRSAPSLGVRTKATDFASKELDGPWVEIWRWLVRFTLLALWLDIQPIALAALARQAGILRQAPDSVAVAVFDGALTKYLTLITPILSPLAGLVIFLSRNLNRAARPDRQRRWTAMVRRFAAKAALIAAAIVVPSLVWLAYLELAFLLQCRGTEAVLPVVLLTVIALIFALSLDPNLTSLHRLYRDRLAKAFLFEPDATMERPSARKVSSSDRRPINPKIHEIRPEDGPFPIVNAALNLEGSAFANRRGRNADFFEFTPLFIGSEATGWRRTASMEEVEPKLDLGTAMAISGAAVSPNMGSATIKALTPTLALLNVRLGFWMRNPVKEKARQTVREYLLDVPAKAMVREMLGRITEDSGTVYVTDGGNIENLGVHALLKRRCRLIVAVDAEADPDMAFGAFLKLQRYARIDLGVLIDLPWQAVRDRTQEVSEAFANRQRVGKSHDPHIAIGTIRYGPDRAQDGILVYVKASLTGDEADYILDYKARNPDFPHETTGDQFFGEEQLEVYRALGFHIMRLFLDGDASAAIVPREGETMEQALARIRASLLGVAKARSSQPT